MKLDTGEVLKVLAVENQAMQYRKDKKQLQRLMTERSEYKHIREMQEDARNEGRSEGQALLVTLLTKLFALNREEDAKLAVADEEARRKFYEEFGLALAD